MASEASGVNYITLDEAKREGQRVAATTAKFLPPGYKDVGWSRGESVQLIDCGKFFLAGLIETLGTKNMIADAMDDIYPDRLESYYYNIGVSNVAVVLNDAATLGAQPLQYFLKIDVCKEEWLTNKRRIMAIYNGAAAACKKSRCAYMGGEIPALNGLVVPNQAILSGSCTGIVNPKSHVIRPQIKAGDCIVLLRSSGVHDNGLTGARELAATLRDGYQTRLSDGSTFGESLLPATALYVQAVQALIRAGIVPHYAVNITGHGWRKIMRHTENFGYVIERITKPHPVFSFIQHHGGHSTRKMFSSYNMGAGFALFIPPRQVLAAMKILRVYHQAINAGFVKKTDGEKYLDILPLGLHFEGSELQVR